MVFASVKESDSVLILPTGYNRNGFTPLNNSCPYHNYCSNCNNVWKAKWKRGERKLICSHFSGTPLIIWGREQWRHPIFLRTFFIAFIARTITRVAWKANKVSEWSRLFHLIKNHRQLNCTAVVLCWPVIAVESGDDIGTRTTAAKFLPKVWTLQTLPQNFSFLFNHRVFKYSSLTWTGTTEPQTSRCCLFFAAFPNVTQQNLSQKWWGFVLTLLHP